MKRLVLNQIVIYYVTSRVIKTQKNKGYMKDTTLKQLVRDRNGQPRGMVVATVIDDTIRLGWSHTNTKAGDRFDKCKALTIALGRAENGWGPSTKVPVSTTKVLNKMLDRAVRYYKNVPVTLA